MRCLVDDSPEDASPSPASMMSAHGIECLVAATGMHEIHSVREYTTLDEMKCMTNLIYQLMVDD